MKAGATSCLGMAMAVAALFQGATARAGIASRTSGVAPLEVFFDAVDPQSGVVQPTPDGEGHLEYADLDYRWSFGDPGSGTWAVDGKSKNLERGYVAAHVYDTPGTYHVTLTVTSPAGAVTTYAETITVQDPEVVYAGDRTTCLSSSGVYDGCPAGAAHVTTTDILDLQAHVATGRRVLLRRGDSWTTTSRMTFWDVTGPVTIGAYGAPTGVDLRGIAANAPSIQVTHASKDDQFIATNRSPDWRIMGLRVTSPATLGTPFAATTDQSAILYYRLKVVGFGMGLCVAH